MKVNMLEAKNQLSRLVKDALEGEEVVIAGASMWPYRTMQRRPSLSTPWR
jgi:hypothetical protein